MKHRLINYKYIYIELLEFSKRHFVAHTNIIPTLVSVSPLRSFVECQIALDSLFISLSSDVVKKAI